MARLPLNPPHFLAPVSEVQRIHGALETDLKRTRSELSERLACRLTSTLSQFQPVLGQTKPKRSIFGVLSQSG